MSSFFSKLVHLGHAPSTPLNNGAPSTPTYDTEPPPAPLLRYTTTGATMIKPRQSKATAPEHYDNIRRLDESGKLHRVTTRLRKAASKAPYRAKHGIKECGPDEFGRPRVFSAMTDRCVLADSKDLRTHGQCPPKTRAVPTTNPRMGGMQYRTVYYIPNPDYRQGMSRQVVNGKLQPTPRACIRAGGTVARQLHGDTEKICDPYHQVFKQFVWKGIDPQSGKYIEKLTGRCVAAKGEHKQCQAHEGLYKKRLFQRDGEGRAIGVVSKKIKEYDPETGEDVVVAEKPSDMYRCFPLTNPPGEPWKLVEHGTLLPKLYRQQRGHVRHELQGTKHKHVARATNKYGGKPKKPKKAKKAAKSKGAAAVPLNRKKSPLRTPRKTVPRTPPKMVPRTP